MGIEGGGRRGFRAAGRWGTGTMVGLMLLFVGPGVYMWATAQEAPEVRLPEVAADSGGTYRVYVAEWGYHTSILVEQPAGWRLGPPGEETAPFVEYAWGDRRYYMESDFRPHVVFATLFLPTEPVAYVDGWARPPGSEARAVLWRAVSGAQLHALLTELEQTIRRDSTGGRVEPFGPVEGYAGRFYPARGRYVIWSNCNTWTVARLRAAGLARRSAGVLFAGQAMRRVGDTWQVTGRK